MRKELFILSFASLLVLSSCNGNSEGKSLEMKDTSKVEKNMIDHKMIEKEEKVMDKKMATDMQEEKELMEDTTEGDNDNMKKKDIKKGSYETYTDEKLANSTGDTILFFHAKWCPSCKKADKVISGELIPEGLNVLKVDYDSSKELQKKYGVTSQHTFVQVDSEGNMVKKWVGGMSVKDIQGQIN